MRIQTKGCGVWLAVTCVACFGACDSAPDSRGPAAPSGGTPDAPAAQRSAAAPVFGTAVVSGRVRFEGDAPPQKKFEMQGDRFCVQHGRTEVAPRFQVGAEGGLPFTFVYIKRGIDAKYPAPAEAKVLDQSGCQYEPHVFGIQTGQTLTITNSDATAHNVNSVATKNERFNFAQPQAGMRKDVTFDRQEIMLKFKCDVHGWMDAYAGVLNHPFYAVTDADGQFEITRLPAGTYQVEAWHELYGTRTADVTVEEDAAQRVEIVFMKR